MFCANCGGPLEEGAKFCPNCGTPVPEAEAAKPDAPETEAPATEVPVTEPVQPEAPADEPVLVVEPSPAAEPIGEPELTLNGMDVPKAPEPPVVNDVPPVAPPPPPVNNGGAGTPPSGGMPDRETMVLLLRIVCGVLGAAFTCLTLYHGVGLLKFVFSYIFSLGDAFHGWFPMGIFGWLIMFVLYLILNVLGVVTPLVAAAVLLLAAIKWDDKYNDLVFGGVALAAALRLVHLVLATLFSVFTGFVSRYFGFVGGAFIGKSLLYVLGYVAAAGIVFAVMYVVGCPPILGKAMEQVKDSIFSAVSELTGGVKKAAAQSKAASDQGAAAQTAGYSYQSGAQAAPNAGMQGNYSRVKKTDRSLLMYILLNIITCGIYSWIFVYNLAQDANDVCDGDGETTSGLVVFILLGMVTCGIYQLIWWYKLCNRMAANAPRYGLTFQENGTTYLLWQLFGALLCGIGPLIAMHIVIKNMNALCAGYNQHNGFYTTPGAQA